MSVRKIAIVGGGTAGWLAANHLAVEMRAENVEITLLESPDFPPIGVGEGTVPRIRETLKKFGITEAELLSSCDCTFKQGIKFSGWREDPEHYYFHPFVSPFPGGYDATSVLLSEQEPFHRVSQACPLMEKGKAPKTVSCGSYQGVVDYAYHFDAKKFGELLARNAREKFGVKHQYVTLVGAVRSDSGDIERLLSASGESLIYDFYVDCSGFSAILIGQQMAVPMLDMSHRILTDTVLACQLPSLPHSPIASYTLAQAHAAGWLWDIPLQSRRGVGFVYAREFMSDDQAAHQLAAYCGQSAEALSFRKIPMTIGYRKQCWVGNCVSLGLSQGFVEPLEATSILVTDFAAELLARNITFDRSSRAAAARYCNQVIEYVWERIIDFVQLHYCISERRDTDFWCAVTAPASLSEELASRLSLWRDRHPLKSDFFSRFDLFDVDNYLYVLYGMHYPTRKRPVTAYEGKILQEAIGQSRQHAEQVAQGLLDQRLWLSRFNEAVKNQKMY